MNIRNYERKDFSRLLSEMNGKCVDVHFDNGCNNNIDNSLKNENNEVSLAQRKRSSLLDNRSMLYAFSSEHHVLHDRDCPKVKEISDKDFRMTSDFVKGMSLCEDCKKRIYIRRGIGDDWRRIADYERFFDRMGLSTQDLFSLFIRHDARVKWIDYNTLEVHVRYDTWRVVQRGERVELWHNNYWQLENLERSMERDFHLQCSCFLSHAYSLFKQICTYSYEQHCAKELNTNNVLSVGEDEQQDILG